MGVAPTNKTRIYVVALVGALLGSVALAADIESEERESCGLRNGALRISGEWKWEIGDYGDRFEGSFYQCSVAEYVRDNARLICLANKGTVRRGRYTLVTVPPGTSESLVRLRCEQWAQSLRFRVQFRESSSQEFIGLYF